MCKLTKNLTLRFNNILSLIDENDRTKPLKGKQVCCVEYPDGRVEIRHDEQSLPYSPLHKDD